jgi:superfamily II DNA or RNA helicase/HKD family nuclease
MTEDSTLHGLHESLITQALESELIAARASGGAVDTALVEDSEAPEALASHLARILRATLARVPSSTQREQRVKIVNRILGVLREELGDNAPGSEQDLAQELTKLLEVHPPTTDLGATRSTARPSTPFSSTDVLMNLRGEPAIGRELQLELESAEHVDLICSFLKWSGYCLLKKGLAKLVQERGGTLRVLTTTYVGVTERRVIDDLVHLGAEVKVSYEHQRTRLHAKAWLFRRPNQLTTAYVGSSNVSHSALVDGLEWNVRLSTLSSPDAITRIHDAFESLWLSPEFEAYDPERDRERFDKSKQSASGSGPAFQYMPMVDLRPHPFQQDMLDRLTFERSAHGHNRNLVVAATGTGKTVVAALDFKRLSAQMPGCSLLFVAHRRQILDQARGTFAMALRDADFGEILAGGSQPIHGKHVFATIQSLNKNRIAQLSPDAYDIVIVDEFHHAESPTYQRLLEHLKPKQLLGLTATPERADGNRVQDTYFDGRIAAELRLWDALEHELLAPFHYFGVDDNTDLSSLEWTRGGYDAAKLGEYFTGNDARLRAVFQAIDEYVGSADEMKALGFCVGVEHARWMATRFTEKGRAAKYLCGQSSEDERRLTIQQLRSGEIKVIFTADLFNEGVDIPDVNTVLMLRPTDSPVLFQQQLGRGLRRSPGKECLTVLDFIGQQHRKFRMDHRLGQLCNEVTRVGAIRAVEGLFPHLPPGCSLHLERTAQATILSNLRQTLGRSLVALENSLRQLGPDACLEQLLEEAAVDLSDLYGTESRTWSSLRRRVEFENAPEGPIEQRLRKAICRMTHFDDECYLLWLANFLENPLPSQPPTEHLERTYLEMLSASLIGFTHGRAPGSLQEALACMREHPVILNDLRAVVAIRRRQLVRMTLALPDSMQIPLRVHGTYSSAEALAGLGHVRADAPRRIDSGVFHVRAQGLDAFFVTTRKTEAQYSPTTLYRDHALSPDLFHWESQSRTAPESATGQRYINHKELGHKILLFARESKLDQNNRTMPYTFLGPADYVSHEGSRPISFIWRLWHPMPKDTYEFSKLARA